MDWASILKSVWMAIMYASQEYAERERDLTATWLLPKSALSQNNQRGFFWLPAFSSATVLARGESIILIIVSID